MQNSKKEVPCISKRLSYRARLHVKKIYSSVYVKNYGFDAVLIVVMELGKSNLPFTTTCVHVHKNYLQIRILFLATNFFKSIRFLEYLHIGTCARQKSLVLILKSTVCTHMDSVAQFITKKNQHFHPAASLGSCVVFLFSAF
jgi:hypothetical protein